jgi:hypothetical protein
MNQASEGKDSQGQGVYIATKFQYDFNYIAEKQVVSLEVEKKKRRTNITMFYVTSETFAEMMSVYVQQSPNLICIINSDCSNVSWR